MLMKRTVLIFAFGAVALASCSSEPVCDYSKAPYNSATSVPSLRAPEGLSAPDRSAALIVPPPPAQANAQVLAKGKCLDRPPSYFATTPTPTSPPPPAAPDKKSSEK